MGVKGSNNVVIRISNDSKFIYFVCSNSHFMFLLFINENTVTDVEDFSRMYKYMLSSAMMTISVGRILSFSYILLIFIYLFFFIFFSIIDYYKILNRVPCIIQ